MTSNEGNTRQGIVLGTSDVAFNRSQINLGSLIAHGESTGELYYHPTSNTVFEENSTTNSCRWYITRAVENRSASPVTIREVGLFSAFGLTTSFMMDRKILDNYVTVPSGNVATFWWEFCYIL
jgi:hypothetical protein